MGAGVGRILGLEDETGVFGALGFVLSPDPNDGATVAMEMFWFVDPAKRGDGLRLLRSFESTAKELGAERLVMAHLTSAHSVELKHLFERLGYREVETHYLKEVAK